MQLSVSGKHLDVGDSLRGHVETTIAASAERYFGRAIEGKVVFHAARSTAFPQSEPGKGTPGPVRDVPAEKLRGVLGLSQVSYVAAQGSLAIADPTLL